MVDFEGVREELATKFSEQSSDQPVGNQAKESEAQEQNQSQSEAQEQAKSEAQALLDLSKVEKFMFDGKEYTLKQLQQERMLQSDYTRKAQELSRERQAIQERQSLEKHFHADLPKVLRDPSLIWELSKHYPKEFVELAQTYLDMSPKQQQQMLDQQQGTSLDPRTIQKYVEQSVKPLQEKLDQYETQVVTKQFEVVFDKMKSKYQNAEDEYVLARLQALDAQKIPLTEDKVEEVFKYFHEKDIQAKETYHKEQLKKQSEANKKAKDVGPGGGTPGQAPKKLKLGEAQEALIKHLSQQHQA